MKAEIKFHPGNIRHGSIVGGGYELHLAPETDEEKELALQLHESIVGVYNQPGTKGAHLSVQAPQLKLDGMVPIRIEVYIPRNRSRGR
jgi:hypothetical protein